jgi:hypothetical protein
MKVLNNLAVKNCRKVAAAVTGRAAAVLRARIMPPLLAVVLLTAVGVGLSASSGSAATKAPQATVYVSIFYYDGGSYPYACAEGHTYHGGLPAEVQYVDNGCAVRVWLHQNNNNSGVSKCFNPKVNNQATNTTVTFVNLYVSSNSNAC